MPVDPSITAVTTRLPCGCEVEVARPGDLVTSCPNGHAGDAPDHRRPWC